MKTTIGSAFALLAAVLVSGCGSGDTTPAAGGNAGGSTPGDSTSAPPAEDNTDKGAADSPGKITLTIGAETWSFPGALCAFSGAPAGEAGSEWNVSFKDGDNQVYISVDSYGPSVSITDVVNYGNLRWSAEGDDAISLEVHGNDISGTGTFTDDASGKTKDGMVTATCASWFEG